MSVPYWRRTGRWERVTCDAAVVGAGIVGLSAALRLARKGLRVRVLERAGVGAGASTRNAGFLMRGCADHYADAVRLYGRARALGLWRFTEDNLADLRAEGVASLPSFRDTPSCLVALDEVQRDDLASAERAMREDGLACRWITPAECDDALFASGAGVAGLVNPGDATVNPAELVGLIADRCREAGVLVHEQAEVFALEPGGPGGPGVTLRAQGLEVVAPRVIVCVNAHAPGLIPELGRVVTPRRGQMLAMRAAGRRLGHAYYANHGSEYFRQADAETIVVGGCRTYFAEREVGTDDATTPYVQDALEAFARRTLGDPVGVTARWAGIMAFTPDALPIVGPAAPQRLGPSVWAVGACTGHGMSMGFRTARAAVDELLGGEPSGFALSRFV